MVYQTDERLKSYLDTNQLARERLCRAVLELDRRFSEVRPRHPRGGPDGGRDIEAVFEAGERAFGAVGFVNQANDSREQKIKIERKFLEDLDSALSSDATPPIFVFLTNVNLTAGEKDSLIGKALSKEGVTHCEIIDRERIRIALDSTDGLAVRFQYLGILLSEAEQASFFARWGDDIQATISSGFRRVEEVLERILFLQEASDPIGRLTFSFQLDDKYSGAAIGHFRLFCLVCLKEPKYKVLELLFGSSDKASRMRPDLSRPLAEEPSGLDRGISGGQWEAYFDPESDSDEDQADSESEDGRFIMVGSSSSVGKDEVEFLAVSYSKGSFIRFAPSITLRDLDDAMFLPILNRSLAEKICGIHVYSDGYKIQEVRVEDMIVDEAEFEPDIPVDFTESELEDKWVRFRPSNGSSSFHIRFYERTPRRLYTTGQIEAGLSAK